MTNKSFNEVIKFECDEINKLLRYLPWSGHRDFIYDLIIQFKPNCIVELGSHYGCSLFTFAQAIKDKSLKTRLIAIDTWMGDSQAGFYEDEVFNIVNETIEKKYSHVDIELKRKLFDEALDDIEDMSIDIIHIDGYHSYDSAKHDFYSWIPKMKKNGIILMHDIGQYTGYGSAVFWNEIKQEYKFNVQFDYSWGLGIIFLDKQEYEKYNELFYSNHYRDLDYKNSNYIKIETIDNYYRIDFLNEYIKEKDSYLEAWRSTVEEKDKYIEELEIKLKEKDIYLEAWKDTVKEKDKYIEKLEIKLKERDIYLEEYISTIEEKVWKTKK